MDKGANKSPSDAIIILSSDDDEDEDVQELFKEFVSKVERFVPKKDVVLFLKLKFAEARSEFVSSAKFKNALRWRTKQLNKLNGYIYSGDICKLLAEDPKLDDCKSETNSEKKAALDLDILCPSENDDVTMHSTRVEAGVNKNIVHPAIDIGDEDNSGISVEKIPIDLTTSQPSTSSANSAASKNVTFKKEDKRKTHEAGTSVPKPSKSPLTPRKRRRLVKRLEEKLKHVGDQIKILNQAELSLDEMDLSDSMYIQECRLKERFNKIWDKICKVQGKPPDTGRVIEKLVKCPPTGFPDIDRAISKFLKKKRGRFPDKFDISNVILETKKKHGLKISPQALREISDEVFICIGNKLQKRRKRDFEFNFGCHLTDDYNASNDPALNNTALRKKLEENKRINKRALDEVFNKFTHYGRMKNHGDSGESSSSDSEKTKPENSTKGRFSHISVTEPSDSSDNECDDFGVEVEDSNDNDQVICRELFDGVSTSGDKKHSGLNLSENDLDDFVIKRPRQITERTCPAESKIGHDVENGNSLRSEEIDLSRNCAIVELPSSVLSDCIDITVESEAVDEDISEACSNDNVHHLEPNVTKKQAVTSMLEDHEITSEQDILQGDNIVFKHQQNSDSEVKLDSNLNNGDLVIASKSLSNITTVSAECSVNTPGVLSKTVGGSSETSNYVDNEVIAEKSQEENGKHEISRDPVSSRNNKTVAKSLPGSPSFVIPLAPGSLKGKKPSLLSRSSNKRKAENGSPEYESPLKIFRSATLEIVGKKDNVSSPKTDSNEQKTSCKESTLSCESDELSITGTSSPPSQATVNGLSSLQKHGPRKLALSLNKNGRNSPKKQDVTVCVSDVIVLSDDDSDS